MQVIPIFNPPELYGGSQQIAYLVSKGLVKRGHNVTVFTSDVKKSNLRERVKQPFEQREGIKIFHFKSISSELARFGYVITPEMRKSLVQNVRQFDLIHVHEARSFQHILVWLLAKEYKIPYVLQAHGLMSGRKALSRTIIDSTIGKSILRNASLVIALNKVEVEQYQRAGLPTKKIALLPNGIDLATYSDLPSKGFFKHKFGIPDSERILLFLGRINKLKGLDILVQAFAAVAVKIRNVTLVIAGSDEGYLGELKTLIETLRLGNRVRIVGPLHGLAKLQAFVDADVFVLPSRTEGFPISVLEAYACGKTIIASSCDGLRDLVIDNNTGILVEPEDAYQLSGAILHALLSDTSKFGLRGKNFVAQYDIEKTVNLLEQLYYNVQFAR